MPLLHAHLVPRLPIRPRCQQRLNHLLPLVQPRNNERRAAKLRVGWADPRVSSVAYGSTSMTTRDIQGHLGMSEGSALGAQRTAHGRRTQRTAHGRCGR